MRDQERALAGAERTKREIIRVLGISITVPNALEFNYIRHFCKREKREKLKTKVFLEVWRGKKTFVACCFFAFIMDVFFYANKKNIDPYYL